MDIDMKTEAEKPRRVLVVDDNEATLTKPVVL